MIDRHRRAHSRRCAGLAPRLVEDRDGNLVAEDEADASLVFEPWMADLLDGWRTIEKVGVEGALLAEGGREALEEGVCPVFWARYKALTAELDRLEAAEREREGEERSRQARRRTDGE